MTNWAWENKDDLDYSSGKGFADSYFAAAPTAVIPEPVSFAIWALLAGLAFASRRRG